MNKQKLRKLKELRQNLFSYSTEFIGEEDSQSVIHNLLRYGFKEHEIYAYLMKTYGKWKIAQISRFMQRPRTTITYWISKVTEQISE